MEGTPARGALRHFLVVPDPRRKNIRFRLIDLLALAILAILCGAEDWPDVALFGKAKKKWLVTFLDLTHGTPSADTFRRVFARLNPEAFETAFRNWMTELVQLSGGKFLAIDGKSLRHSFQHAWDSNSMAHMVSVFATANGQVLTQLAVAGKGQELAAIRQILGLVDLTGAVVSIDALGCQKDVAEKIVASGGQYILALTENQPTTYTKVKALLDEGILTGFADLPCDYHQEVDAGHGRLETRRVWVTDQVQHLKGLEAWQGLASVAVIEATREVFGGKTSTERRYYLSAIPGRDAAFFAAAQRGHWGIENNLHWVLDVIFREDESRLRQGHGAENFSRLRRLALNLLKANGRKGSLKGKRKLAGWDHEFLLELLAGGHIS
jgi:predicted transposase YbfD/YdcC